MASRLIGQDRRGAVSAKPAQLISRELMEIYQRLLAHFGHRHWWPAETPFEVIVGAILTQNVSWRSAAAAIANLKEAGLLSLDGLVGVDERELAALLRPARYHLQKAVKLKAFCRVVAEEYGGDLGAFLSQDLQALRRRLLKIYGIGPETADAIILYAAEKPIFVIDAYTHRIFHRLGYFGENAKYEEMQEFFMKHLPPDVALYNDYHAQIDALGHHLCLKKMPRCAECPVADICRWKGEEEEPACAAERADGRVEGKPRKILAQGERPLPEAGGRD